MVKDIIYLIIVSIIFTIILYCIKSPKQNVKSQYIHCNNGLVIKRNQILYVKKDTETTQYLIEIDLVKGNEILYFNNINDRNKEYENIINQL